jgi:hypothetical protein
MRGRISPAGVGAGEIENKVRLNLNDIAISSSSAALVSCLRFSPAAIHRVKSRRRSQPSMPLLAGRLGGEDRGGLLVMSHESLLKSPSAPAGIGAFNTPKKRRQRGEIPFRGGNPPL